MSKSKEFDMLDAFVALKDLDDDAVTPMITPRTRGTKIREGKGYPLHGGNQALDSAKEFLKENDEIQLEVIDPNADDVEHVKDRIDYVGQMILRCNRCHANKFIDMDKLVESESEKGTYNIEEECPNCKTSGAGYELIGQVGKFEEKQPEAEATAETSDDAKQEVEATEEATIENDEVTDEVKFDNDLESETEEAAETEETETDTASTDEVADVTDDESETETDMMETETTEDDDILDLPSLGDEADEEVKEDDDEEDVQESLHESVFYEDLKAAEQSDEEPSSPEDNEVEPYTEAVEVIQNTTISEVLGSFLDADKVGRIEITNRCDNKKDQKVYDGDYNNLPLNIANAKCTGFDVNNRTLACNIDQDENHGRRPVEDILSKFADSKSDNIHLYDIASSEEIFKGTREDAVKNFGKCGFISIDTPAVIRMTISDPSILSRVCDTCRSDEDKLVEHIITENDLSITRLNKVNSNEYWIKESIKEREDLELIYETYVKPCGKDLAKEFKAVTGYSNALEEAFEAGYAAASKDVNEVFDYYQDGDTFELEWFRAAMLDEAGKIVTEDFATVTRHVDGSFTVDGEMMFSDGHKDIVDALVDAIESIPNADAYADIEYTLEDELNDFMTSEQKAALAARLDRVVEEVEDDPEEEELEEGLGQVFKKFMTDVQNSADKDREERLEYLYLELENPDLPDAKRARIKREVSRLEATLAKHNEKARARDAAAESEPAETRELAGVVDEAYMSRDQMIAALRANGRNYRFDKYTDAQIYRMYQKHALAPQNKAKVATVINTLVKDEVDAIKTYDKAIDDVAQSGSDPTGEVRATLDHIKAEEEEHIAELNGLTCDRCGVRLNDGGTCPSCDHGEEDMDESINESIDPKLSKIVKDSINHMINDLGYDANDEEFADDVLADIENNYDVDAPTEPRAYAAWASEIFAEINKQVSNLSEDEELVPVDRELLRQIVDEEMPFAIKEWGTSISKLTDHFLSVMREAMFQQPDVAELKELITEYLEHGDFDIAESFQSFKTRKDLAEAITECKNNSTPYTVRRSVKEGYRYDLVLHEDKKAVIDLTEGDNLPAERPATEMTSTEAELSAKLMRISQDIANAINVVYGIDASPELIVADMLQDLRLISRDISISDLEDTPMNALTAQMYQSYEQFYEFMDSIVSGLTGQTIHSTPEQKLETAIKMLDGPNFTGAAIRKGIEDTRFMRMVAAGQVPFIPANARPLIGEDLDKDDSIDVDTDKFDSDMNEYFTEAYEDSMLYTTTGGSVEPDGTIVLEGMLRTEETCSDVTFKLTPEKNLYESLVEGLDKKAVLESATYEVTNDLSEEVFTFKFSD